MVRPHTVVKLFIIEIVKQKIDFDCTVHDSQLLLCTVLVCQRARLLMVR